jgi:hypothetical protein
MALFQKRRIPFPGLLSVLVLTNFLHMVVSEGSAGQEGHDNGEHESNLHGSQ